MFLFFCLKKKKKSFDQSRGIETGIENHLKIDPTDQEESRQPESLSLKTGFFFLNRFD